MITTTIMDNMIVQMIRVKFKTSFSKVERPLLGLFVNFAILPKTV